jgi:hypothetical protein
MQCLLTKVLKRYEDEVNEAVYTGNAVDLVIVASCLPIDQKTITLARYVEEVRASASRGNLYPFRAETTCCQQGNPFPTHSHKRNGCPWGKDGPE